ncbi:MAG: LPS assembly protein LptD, partial [Methylococcaceae bacterium]|nr:LPS assembly protein LptD [Methylococcaceae bacterium]
SLMKLKSDEVVLRNSQFILETVPSRGVARVVHIDDKYKSRYEPATYTTCPPGNQNWLLHAKNISIDKESGRGVAKQAWLEFMGVPFLYTPWISFPVDDRRKSGFLSPYVGHSTTNGFNIVAPYYFNLAPNYDWTLTPRVMTNRGIQLRNEFRYLSESSNGRILAELFPYDNAYPARDPNTSLAQYYKTREKYGTRGQFGWVGNTRLMDSLKAHVDLHYVSDADYLNQLGTLLYINDWRNIRSWANLSYAEGGFSATLAADAYQTLDPTISKAGRPYRRLPQFTFGYNRALFGTGLQFQGTGEFVQFDHSVNVTAQRLNLRPSLSYPLQNTWGYLTPRISLQHTEYWLNWPQTADGLNSQKIYGDTFSRTAPIFSVDSGISFEREFSLGSTSMQQTLEPRLFYLYVPKTKQPVLNFDSAEYDFNFYQLFRENRFAGNDRLSDANQLTPALTTRFIDQDSGLERLKLSIGKIIYFKDPLVTIAKNAAQTTIKSNLVGEANSMLSDNWSIRSTGQWNPKYDRVDRGQVSLQYNNKANQLLNLGYRYRRDPYEGVLPPDKSNPRSTDQTDFSFRLPITDGWFAIGRWQYSLDTKLTVEAMAGIERETCCWRFSLLGLQYQNGAYGTVATNTSSNNPVTSNTTFFFQVEFKNLGRFGQQVDQFLASTISGFRTDYDTYGTNPQGF